jgi:hypothetical protein
MAGVPTHVSLQGSYYLATGLWSVISRPTFEAVTGPKIDYWLVRTVGTLSAVIGASLLLADRRGRASTPEIAALATGSAAAFATIDVVYVSRGRISRVYLIDAAAQGTLLASWFATLPRRRSDEG